MINVNSNINYIYCITKKNDIITAINILMLTINDDKITKFDDITSICY